MIVLIDILSIAAMVGMILLIILYPTLKIGKLHFSTFYFPLLLCVIVGTLLLYLVKFTGANLVILYIFATLMMGGIFLST